MVRASTKGWCECEHAKKATIKIVNEKENVPNILIWMVKKSACTCVDVFMEACMLLEQRT